MSQSESTYRASIGLLAVLIGLSAFGSSKVYGLLSEKRQADATKVSKPSGFEPIRYRDPIKPRRVVDKSEYPKFKRSLLGNYQVVDLSDSRHVIVSKPNPAEKKTEFFYGHIDEATKLEHLTRLRDPQPGCYYLLSVDGKPVEQRLPIVSIRRRNMSAVPFVNPFSFGGQYGAFRPIHTMLADGSTIRLKHQVLPESGSTFNIVRESAEGDEQVLYETNTDLVLFFVEGNGNVWFQEGLVGNKNGTVKLGRISKGKVDTFSLPEGIQYALYISVAGDHLALSGATSRKGEPNRAFFRNLSTSKDWEELPLEEGFNFSVARATSNDGWVYGTQDKIREGVSRPVAWKDGGIVHLNNLPAWPQSGNSTYIVTSNSRGDLYLRCILDSSTGQSEYYLLIRQ